MNMATGNFSSRITTHPDRIMRLRLVCTSTKLWIQKQTVNSDKSVLLLARKFIQWRMSKHLSFIIVLFVDERFSAKQNHV